MVPASTLMYGSSFWSVTRKPRASSSEPMEADASPLPSDDTTPPVTKMYFVGTSSLLPWPSASVEHTRFPRLGPRPLRRAGGHAGHRAPPPPPDHAGPRARPLPRHGARGERVAPCPPTIPPP